ncbi:hypothetical protein ATANTOWER_006169 [Ataeniobius toweri]|uniref:Uncharacterized protein n=1 Tax=Ataeniobius toweri TaxID=208326 RepID=A0ABU7BNM2_9TELE|nr:hypothetical protein [Ataeniobius toweri]
MYRETLLCGSYVQVVLLGLFCCSCGLVPDVSACKQEPETPDWRMTLRTIRNGIHKIDTYLNVALDLFGGDDGLCRYRCSDGEIENLFRAFFSLVTNLLGDAKY